MTIAAGTCLFDVNKSKRQRNYNLVNKQFEEEAKQERGKNLSEQC